MFRGLVVLFLVLVFAAFIVSIGHFLFCVLEERVNRSFNILLTDSHVVGFMYVGDGGSLWSIARQHYSGHDSREVVHAIRVVNGMRDTSVVRVGDKILLPDMSLF